MRGGGVLGGRGGEGKVALSSLLLSSPYTPPPPPTTVALGRPETGSPLTPLAPHTHTPRERHPATKYNANSIKRSLRHDLPQ